MHPIILNEIAKDRIADWHRQAERDHMAQAARLARKERDRHFVPGHLAIVLGRRVLAAVGGNKTRAARVLGLDRRSVYRRLGRSESSQDAEAASDLASAARRRRMPSALAF